MSARQIRMPVHRVAATTIPLHKIKGRGAVSSPPGRFESEQRESVIDGWSAEESFAPVATDVARDNRQDAPAASAVTVVRNHHIRRAISRNQSPDIFFDRAVNPYRGCEHGCVYCYARPGHAYEGLSPGLDFETRIFARPGLPEKLALELDAPAYSRQPCEPITIGSFTDPYQPVDRDLQITRQTIRVLLERRHPFAIVTKGALIERDIDLLEQAAQLNLVACYLSVTTLDTELARTFEPRAPGPARRLKAIARLASRNVPVGVMTAPIVPFINDADLEKILMAAADAGARSAHYTVVRLPNEVRPVFQDWLQARFPERADRVMNRIRDLRDGRANDPRFHSRMRGTGPWADLIANRFQIAARKNGLTRQRPALETGLFKPLAAIAQAPLF